MSKEIIDLLENAIKEHNDDCIFCALKDTRINSALTLIDTAESINKDLLKACEATLRFGLNPSLEKMVTVAIAKATNEFTNK